MTIRLKGTTLGTATDTKGLFTLEFTGKVDTIVVSFIGMKTQYVKLEKNKEEYLIKMEEDIQTMEEVVVTTGYQKFSKRELASSIVTLKAEDVVVAGAMTIDQMLQGKVAGMSVTLTSGEPSATPEDPYTRYFDNQRNEGSDLDCRPVLFRKVLCLLTCPISTVLMPNI